MFNVCSISLNALMTVLTPVFLFLVRMPGAETSVILTPGTDQRTERRREREDAFLQAEASVLQLGSDVR